MSNFKRYKEGLGMWLEIGCDLIPRRINWHMLGFFTPIILVVVVFILGILWGKGWFH